VFAFGSNEKLQQPAMPSGLQAVHLERMEQMQRSVWRRCDTALARSEDGDEVWGKALRRNLTDSVLQQPGMREGLWAYSMD